MFQKGILSTRKWRWRRYWSNDEEERVQKPLRKYGLVWICVRVPAKLRSAALDCATITSPHYVRPSQEIYDRGLNDRAVSNPHIFTRKADSKEYHKPVTHTANLYNNKIFLANQPQCCRGAIAMQNYLINIHFQQSCSAVLFLNISEGREWFPCTRICT
jgi:hypothetical protein